MGRFARAFVMIAVVASVVAACSSSAKPKADSNQPLSKAEYIKRSDAICTSYQDRVSAAVGAAGSGLTLAQAKATFYEKLIPLFRSEHAELVALRPPKADSALLDKALLGLASAISTIQARVGGAQNMADLNAIAPTGIARWKTAVGKYGMHVCGSVQK